MFTCFTYKTVLEVQIITRMLHGPVISFHVCMYNTHTRPASYHFSNFLPCCYMHSPLTLNCLCLPQHPSIVSLHYAFQTNHKLYLILEYLNGKPSYISHKTHIILRVASLYMMCTGVFGIHCFANLGNIYQNLFSMCKYQLCNAFLELT